MTLARNPAFEGKTPRPLTATCHDGTPFITIRCLTCGADSHVHESQLAPRGVEMAVRCSGCRGFIEYESDELHDGFAQMRADGWLA